MVILPFCVMSFDLVLRYGHHVHDNSYCLCDINSFAKGSMGWQWRGGNNLPYYSSSVTHLPSKSDESTSLTWEFTDLDVSEVENFEGLLSCVKQLVAVQQHNSVRDVEDQDDNLLTTQSMVYGWLPNTNNNYLYAQLAHDVGCHRFAASSITALADMAANVVVPLDGKAIFLGLKAKHIKPVLSLGMRMEGCALSCDCPAAELREILRALQQGLDRIQTRKSKIPFTRVSSARYTIKCRTHIYLILIIPLALCALCCCVATASLTSLFNIFCRAKHIEKARNKRHSSSTLSHPPKLKLWAKVTESTTLEHVQQMLAIMSIECPNSTVFEGFWGEAAGSFNNVQWRRLRDKVENTLGCGIQLELVVPFEEKEEVINSEPIPTHSNSNTSIAFENDRRTWFITPSSKWGAV
eukprot:518793_1